ncbi:2,3-diaminopropionate biosynthesis protein SbnB [Chitinophaga solisilvae]|uniref:2,3-diaminopropionate biosynthesis protein SbnB n=1 Tax=Chitinophaga solisilvae TaxID=1233460 RepID=A0A3S1JJ61_9BACT|nr:2,3-diaminopropionate biosynthesis protein SbnB [Chitinophaga solisilvae]NSL86992.1 2,3-diaminopropionate biosynthesis protein SbnB [Chitinophaga solisilvae]
MLYLNADNIKEIGTAWDVLTGVIENSVHALNQNDFSQPIKPYLRYGDAKNRIIAMPAYVGGNAPLAGIKWIASFPDNIYKNKLRANSVTILNEHDSGVPICVINTSLISAVRTAAVSGVLIKEYIKVSDKNRDLHVSINGFGPIGRTHLQMVTSLLGDRIEKIYLYDINGIDIDTIDSAYKHKVVVASSWEEGYAVSNIYITCTVSDSPYVDKPPVKGSLQLNVSLRDYKTSIRQYIDVMVVDDWDEVCRQNTDIENMHKQVGLQKSDTVSIADVVCREALKGQDESAVFMFNPMGMAIFDIAIGGYYYQEAMSKGVGSIMPN